MKPFNAQQTLLGSVWEWEHVVTYPRPFCGELILQVMILTLKEVWPRETNFLSIIL